MAPVSKTRWWATLGAAIIFCILLLGVSLQQTWVHGFDRLIIGWIRHPLPPMLTQTIVTITHSGDPQPVTAITLILVLVLVITRHAKGALFLGWNVLVWAGLGNSLIKHLVQRPRPTVDRLVAASSYSFPSGHSITAMLLWGSLIVMIAWQHHEHRKWALSLSLIFSCWIVIIGLSRIYVGVHYPSDVAAGWSLGFVLLTLTQWLLFRKEAPSS